MLRVGVTGAPVGVGAADAIGLLQQPDAAADVLPSAGWVDAWPPPLVPAASCPLAPPPPQAARPRVSATAAVQGGARRRGANITTNLGNGRAVAHGRDWGHRRWQVAVNSGPSLPQHGDRRHRTVGRWHSTSTTSLPCPGPLD